MTHLPHVRLRALRRLSIAARMMRVSKRKRQPSARVVGVMNQTVAALMCVLRPSKWSGVAQIKVMKHSVVRNARKKTDAVSILRQDHRWMGMLRSNSARRYLPAQGNPSHAHRGVIRCCLTAHALQILSCLRSVLKPGGVGSRHG